jgi:hypothetical protein
MLTYNLEKKLNQLSEHLSLVHLVLVSEKLILLASLFYVLLEDEEA